MCVPGGGKWQLPSSLGHARLCLWEFGNKLKFKTLTHQYEIEKKLNYSSYTSFWSSYSNNLERLQWTPQSSEELQKFLAGLPPRVKSKLGFGLKKKIYLQSLPRLYCLLAFTLPISTSSDNHNPICNFHILFAFTFY